MTASRKHLLGTVAGIILALLVLPVLAVNILILVNGYSGDETAVTVGDNTVFLVKEDTQISSNVTLDAGDLAIAATKDLQKLRVGDIICFQDGGSLKFGMISSLRSEGTELSSYLLHPQMNSNSTNFVDPNMVVGKVDKVWSGLGNVVLFMDSTVGTLICVGLPILLFAIFETWLHNSWRKKGLTENLEGYGKKEKAAAAPEPKEQPVEPVLPKEPKAKAKKEKKTWKDLSIPFKKKEPESSLWMTEADASVNAEKPVAPVKPITITSKAPAKQPAGTLPLFSAEEQKELKEAKQLKQEAEDLSSGDISSLINEYLDTPEPVKEKAQVGIKKVEKAPEGAKVIKEPTYVKKVTAKDLAGKKDVVVIRKAGK